METNKLGILLGSFIVILVGLILLRSIADSTSQLDDIITTGSNESIAWTNNTAITLAHPKLVSGSDILYNSSNKLVRNTDYTITAKAITITNRTTDSSMASSLNLTYNYEGENYISDNTSRTLINLIPLFFALAIVLVGYLIVTKSFNDLM